MLGARHSSGASSHALPDRRLPAGIMIMSRQDAGGPEDHDAPLTAEFTPPLVARAQRYFSFPAVASHSGAAMVSLKFLNMRLNEMLMRSF